LDVQASCHLSLTQDAEGNPTGTIYRTGDTISQSELDTVPGLQVVLERDGGWMFLPDP
jgi:hypothetical protein